MNPHDAVAPEIYQRIIGFEKLTGHFGYWPSFHDAEMISILLQRSGQVAFGGPVATLKLATFEWEQDPVTGHTVLAPPCLVEFRFTEVDDLHLKDFSHQNAIYSLDWLAEPDGVRIARLRVRFPAGLGVDGTFTCTTAEVLSVVLGAPPTIFAPNDEP